jgi:hypothetical protein
VGEGLYNTSAGLVENQTVILSIKGDRDLTTGVTGTQMASSNAVITNGSGSVVRIDATQLVLVRPPSDSRRIDTTDEVLSSINFQVQPQIQAQDATGNLDIHFVDVITSTLQTGSGTLAGTATATAVGGIATFADLRYTSASDGEGFVLSFDDETAGSGGDLSAVPTTGLSADVVASKIAYSIQPSPLTVFVNENFGVNGVAVECLDTGGSLDVDYNGLVSIIPVTIGTSTPVGGNFSVKPTLSQNASKGQVVWSGFSYDVAANFELLASSVGLNSVRSSAITVNIKQTNNIPIVANAIPPKAMVIGEVSFARDLTTGPAVFIDSDGDALKFTATSSDNSVAIVSIVGNQIVVDPGASGAAKVTITADDENGGVATTIFPVMVASKQSIFHIPTSSLPTIDGVLAEWQTLLGDPQLHQDHFVSVLGDLKGFLSTSDQKVEVWLGWNQTTNLLYVAARVTDDAFGIRSDESNAQLAWRGDNMQVFIDADKSGGTYSETNLQAQHFAMSASGVRGPTLLPNGIENPGGVKCVMVSSGNVYSYEWAIPAWKIFTPPNSATNHALKSNSTIGLSFAFGDAETQSAADLGNFHALNALFGRDINTNDSGQFWSFVLSAPVIQVSSSTPPGSQVAVSLLPTSSDFSASNVSLSFETVANSGATQLTVTGSGPPPPANFAPVGDPVYYDLTTTAGHTGNIDLCFDYAGTSLDGQVGLALLHFDQFGWIDITTSRDVINKRICGRTPGFSTFTILQQTIQVPVAAPFSGTTLNTFTPNISWGAVPGAINYTVEYANNVNFSGSVEITGITNTSYTFTSPLADGSYFWRVKAVGSGGVTSAPSSTDSFVIIPTLSEWTTLLLALGMFGYMVWHHRRISV